MNSILSRQIAAWEVTEFREKVNTGLCEAA